MAEEKSYEKPCLKNATSVLRLYNFPPNNIVKKEDLTDFCKRFDPKIGSSRILHITETVRCFAVKFSSEINALRVGILLNGLFINRYRLYATFAVNARVNKLKTKSLRPKHPATTTSWGHQEQTKKKRKRRKKTKGNKTAHCNDIVNEDVIEGIRYLENKNYSRDIIDQARGLTMKEIIDIEKQIQEQNRFIQDSSNLSKKSQIQLVNSFDRDSKPCDISNHIVEQLNKSKSWYFNKVDQFIRRKQNRDQQRYQASTSKVHSTGPIGIPTPSSVEIVATTSISTVERASTSNSSPALDMVFLEETEIIKALTGLESKKPSRILDNSVQELDSQSEDEEPENCRKYKAFISQKSNVTSKLRAAYNLDMATDLSQIIKSISYQWIQISNITDISTFEKATQLLMNNTSLKNVESIDFRRCHLRGHNFDYSQRCKHVKHLRFFDCCIGHGSGIATLLQLTVDHLKFLEVHSPSIINALPNANLGFKQLSVIICELRSAENCHHMRDFINANNLRLSRFVCTIAFSMQVNRHVLSNESEAVKYLFEEIKCPEIFIALSDHIGNDMKENGIVQVLESVAPLKEFNRPGEFSLNCNSRFENLIELVKLNKVLTQLEFSNVIFDHSEWEVFGERFSNVRTLRITNSSMLIPGLPEVLSRWFPALEKLYLSDVQLNYCIDRPMLSNIGYDDLTNHFLHYCRKLREIHLLRENSSNSIDLVPNMLAAQNEIRAHQKSPEKVKIYLYGQCYINDIEKNRNYHLDHITAINTRYETEHWAEESYPFVYHPIPRFT